MVSPSNQSEENKHLCEIQSIQDEGVISLERTSRKIRIYLQIGSEGCLSFSTFSQGVSKIDKV